MNDKVMKVVFMDGQIMMGRIKQWTEGDEYAVLSNVFELKIVPVNEREAQVVAMMPQHMTDDIIIPLGNFVKYYGTVDDEGKEFYDKQAIKMRAKKSGLEVDTRNIHDVRDMISKKI